MQMTEHNDFEIMRLELVKEWHPTKNGDLKPSDVTRGSGKKVWWLGSCGHEWEAEIKSRSLRNTGCPYCVNRKVLRGYNDLETLHPELAKEWHPTKNGDLKPSDVTSGSHKKVWWLGPCGHEWATVIHNRKAGSNCPICIHLRKGHNDLETLCPTLAKEWHPTKNGNLKPSDITRSSKEKVWWLGPCGHEWKIAIYNRALRNTGCPHCKKNVKRNVKLIEAYPELAKEWHPAKNGTLKPSDVIRSSNEKVWWLGPCGHEWEARVVARTYMNTECPYCVNHKVLKGYNDLETAHPELAKEWHPAKNGTLKPSDVIRSSTKKVWWLGPCGHEWEARVVARTDKNTECPYCVNHKVLRGYNDLETAHPELANEWHPTKNGFLKPSDVTRNSTKKVWWLGSCGHEWKTVIYSRALGNTGCPYCANNIRGPKQVIRKEWPQNLLYQLYKRGLKGEADEKVILEIVMKQKEHYREIILLRYKDHSTITNIAEQKRCSKQAVHSLIIYAEKNIIKMYNL